MANQAIEPPRPRRRTRSVKQWHERDARRALGAWEKSGQTIHSFARQIGVSPKRLYWWRQRLAQTTPSNPLPSSFIPVTVRPSTAEAISLTANASLGAPVSVHIREHVRVELRELDETTAAWVATLLKTLGEAHSCS